MVPSPQRITIFTSGLAQYCSKRHVNLIMVHIHYSLETRTRSKRRMYVLIAIAISQPFRLLKRCMFAIFTQEDVDISTLVLFVVTFSCSSSDIDVSRFISQQSQCARWRPLLSDFYYISRKPCKLHDFNTIPSPTLHYQWNQILTSCSSTIGVSP